MGAFRIQEKRAADAALFPRTVLLHTQQLVPGIAAHQAVGGNTPGHLEALDRRGGVGPVDTIRPAGTQRTVSPRLAVVSNGSVSVVPETTGADTAGLASCAPARASKGKLSPGQPVAFTSL